jgi:hypothetical protein
MPIEIPDGRSVLYAVFYQPVGVGYICQLIMEGKTADEIELMWKDDIETLKTADSLGFAAVVRPSLARVPIRLPELIDLFCRL